MKNLTFIVFLTLVAAGVYFLIYLFSAFMIPPLRPISPVEVKILQIGERTFKLDVARTKAERERGLSGHDRLAPDQGMLFVFEKPARYGFWMKDMKFPIDIIWLKDNRIVYAVLDAPPMNSAYPKIYYPPSETDRAIELAAGSFRALNLKPGDSLNL